MQAYKSNRFLRVSFQTLVFLIVLLAIPQFGNAQNPYRIRLEHVHGELHDSTHFVHSISIYLDAAAGPITGFEFNFGFDTTQFKLISASGDSALMSRTSGTGWDFFEATAAPFGPCGPACENGKARIVARADIGSVPGAGVPFNPTSFPAKLATLTFQTPSDSVWECQYKILRFVWFDCQDNYLVGGDGSTVHVVRDVYDIDANFPLLDSTSGYPTFSGIQFDSCAMGFSQSTVRDMTFINGIFDFACLDSIDPRGDINSNDIANEVADAVLFSNYFLNGLSVFTENEQIQLSNSDANADGWQGGIEDLSFLSRVICGEIPPYPREPAGPNPSVVTTFSRSGDVWSVDRPILAGFIVARGNVVPEVLAAGFTLGYTFENNRTRILVSGLFQGFPDSCNISASGPILKLSAPIAYAEFATLEPYRVLTIYDCCVGIRGDANGDGGIPNIVDLAAMVHQVFYFWKSLSIVCLQEADMDNSGQVNIVDVTQLVSYLFQQGPAPTACP